MSAKVSVIVYIIICVEVGVLLILLPWTNFWDENYFLGFIQSRLHAPWLVTVLASGYFRGLVTALGVVNIVAAIRDVFRFRESVESLSEWENSSKSSS